MGFLVICSGVVLLQLSKSAKDVPDTAVLKGDLDQIRTVGEQEQPESEPKADAIRGTAALIRRLSQARQRWEAEEARKVYEEKLKDQMEPISENEVVEWDGLRRRKTVLEPGLEGIQRRKTLHPPLGLTKFPSYHEDEDVQSATDRPERHSPSHTPNSFFHGFRKRRGSSANRISVDPVAFSPRPQERSPIPEAEVVSVSGDKALDHGDATELRNVLGLPAGLRPRDDSGRSSPGRSIAWAADNAGSRSKRSRELLSPSPRPHTAGSGRRQFSFQNVFHRHKEDLSGDEARPPPGRSRSPPGSAPDSGSGSHGRGRGRSIRLRGTGDGATEEERLGLVKGDSNQAAGGPATSPESSPASDGLSGLSPVRSISEAVLPLGSGSGGPSVMAGRSAASHAYADADDLARYEAHRQKWSESSPELRQPPGSAVDFEKQGASRRRPGGSEGGGGALI